MADARGRLAVALILLAGAAGSILAQGFALPSGINAYHWPALFQWWATPEGPHDPFVDSLQHFVTFFWPALGLVATEENWTWLLPLVHFALRVLLVLALYLVFDRLKPGRRPGAALLAATLPVGLAFFIESPLGHGEVLLDNLSHSSANPPLALFVFYCALRGRWIAAGLLLGLLFNINAFVAAWLGLATALAFWLRERPALGSALRRQGLPALTLALLLALPTAWRIWETLQATAPTLPDYDFREFLRAYFAGHFFPDATDAAGWLLFGLLAAGLAWLSAQLPLALEPAPLAAWRGLVLGLGAVVLFGIVLPYVSASRLLLNAHPLRMDFLLVWLFYTGLGLWTLREARLDPRTALAWLALFGGFWTAVAVLLPLAALRRQASPRLALWLAALAVAIALCGALPAGSLSPPRTVRAIELICLLGALPFALGPTVARHWAPALGLLAALAFAPPDFGAWSAILVLLSLAATLVDWPWRIRAEKALPWVYAAIGLALAFMLRDEPRVALLLAAGPLVPLLLSRLNGGQTPRGFASGLSAHHLLLVALVALWPGLQHLIATGRIDRYDEAALDFLALQRWARQETPPGSDFLVPQSQLVPNLVPSFWTESRRSAWVDWRMGAGAHWLPDFYWLWRERMAEVTALGDTEAKLAYARAHAIDYIILEEAGSARPEVVYANAHYSVLKTLP